MNLKRTLSLTHPQQKSTAPHSPRNADVRSNCGKLERIRLLRPPTTPRGHQNSAPTTEHETCVYVSLDNIAHKRSQTVNPPSSLINIQVFQGHYETAVTPPLKSLARNSPHHPPQRAGCVHILLHTLFHPPIPYPSSNSSKSIVQVRYFGQCLGRDVGTSWGWVYTDAHLGY